MYVFRGIFLFYTIFFYIICFYMFLYFSFILIFYFACNSAFEQGYLEPWRYINAFIILFIILYYSHDDLSVLSMSAVGFQKRKF